MNVLIPSAKTVSEELQIIGKLPAIIYPVNEGIVFDYLLQQYEDTAEKIDILCYENADKVHRRLANYKSTKIRIIDLQSIDDLGHTIYEGLSDEAEPVIINFADTIVLDNIYENSGDKFFYSEDTVSNIWTFFEMEDGRISKIEDKPLYSTQTFIKKKLFVGVFQINDSKCLKDCLIQSFNNRNKTMNSFYQALQLYSELHPFEAVPTENWFDIGHIDKYFGSELEVKARKFNHICIDKNRGILKKTSDDKEKFIGEIKWYLKLPADVEYVRPRIFNYSTSYTNPYVEMEYYAYHTVHELFLYGDMKYQQWESIFKRISFVCKDFKRYTLKDDKIQETLEEMYLTKTLERFERLKEDKRFSAYFEGNIKVNGVLYKSLNQLSILLKKIIPDMLYDVNEFCIIHGDLCFANIMVDGNCSFIKVIDPRGKFGKFDIYGDFRYELAKLFHSMDGKYDFIIKDLFNVEYNLKSAEINYNILDRKRDFDLYNVFIEIFQQEIGDDFKKIELIEALLFLSMIPLHGESLNHQLVMLGTGLEILNRVVNIEFCEEEK